MQLDSRERSKMTIKEAIDILNKLKDDNIYGQAVSTVIPLLEKHTPKKPVVKWDDGAYTAYCPTCKRLVYDVDWFKSTKEKYHQTICLHCGQKFTQTSNTLGRWLD